MDFVQPMESTFESLRQLLVQRLTIIADTALRESDPAAQLDSLRTVSDAIEAWRSKHEGDCPAKLRHFLQQSSLQKALEFIESM
jgi:hypothetical protein